MTTSPHTLQKALRKILWQLGGGYGGEVIYGKDTGVTPFDTDEDEKGLTDDLLSLIKTVGTKVVGKNDRKLTKKELQMIVEANDNQLTFDEIKQSDNLIKTYQNYLRSEQRKALEDIISGKEKI